MAESPFGDQQEQSDWEKQAYFISRVHACPWEGAVAMSEPQRVNSSTEAAHAAPHAVLTCLDS